MKKHLFLLILFFCQSYLFSQSVFMKSFGTEQREDLIDIVDATGGGAFIMGRSYLNLQLLKVDATGAQEWTQEYPITDIFSGGIEKTADGGLILFGNGDLPLYPNSSFIMKTNAQGVISWTKIYSLAVNGFYIRSVKTTLDGGFIAVGQSQSFGSGQSFIARLNASGQLIWRTDVSATIPNTTFEAYEVLESQIDSGIIAIGKTRDPSGNNLDMPIVKCDQNGNVLWTKKIEDTPSIIISIPKNSVEFPNGELRFSNGSSLITLDVNGDLGSQLSFDNFGIDGCTKSLPSGKFAIFGNVDGLQEDFQQYAFGVSLFDAAGNSLWNRRIIGAKDSWPVNAVLSEDDGVIIGLNTLGYSHGLSDYFVMKTDSVGTACMGDSINLLPIINQFSTTTYPCVDTTILSLNSYSIDLTDPILVGTNMEQDICVCVPPTANFEIHEEGIIIDSSLWATEWYWDFGDGEIDTSAVEPFHSYAVDTTYTVCLTVSNECGSDSICRTFNYHYTPIGIEELEQEKLAVMISPNPFSTETLLTFSQEHCSTIRVIDLLGHQLVETVVTGKQFVLPRNQMKEGTYFIVIHDSFTNQTMNKVVVVL